MAGPEQTSRALVSVRPEHGCAGRPDRTFPAVTLWREAMLDAGDVTLTADKIGKPAARAKSPRQPGAAAEQGTQVSAALRHAYEEAVKEDVPTEFLDLLGKLS